MKFTSLKNVTVLSAAAVISFFAACKNDTKTTASTPASSTATVSANEKIVYVNSDSLLNNYQYFKDIKTKLDAKSKNAQADMQSKSQAFQREVNQYQQQQNSLSADQRAATEQRLARKQQELQAYQQNAGQALQNEQASEQEKLYNKVADYLKGFAKNKGFKLVLTYSKGNSAILFADESLDVTTEVIKGLNEDYKNSTK